MDAQEHIDKAEEVIKHAQPGQYPAAAEARAKVASIHIKLAQWKYEHGTTMF